MRSKRKKDFHVVNNVLSMILLIGVVCYEIGIFILDIAKSEDELLTIERFDLLGMKIAIESMLYYICMGAMDIFFIGNLLILPLRYRWNTLLGWNQIFIKYLKITIIILSSMLVFTGLHPKSAMDYFFPIWALLCYFCILILVSCIFWKIANRSKINRTNKEYNI